MEETHSTIKSFKDLRTWREAHALVLSIYQTTESFPTTQQFILSSQLQRAAISITSNIAEGFSRNTIADKINFFHIALGSLTEVQNQVEIAKDLQFLNQENYVNIENQIETISKMLHGLIKTTKSLPFQKHNVPDTKED